MSILILHLNAKERLKYINTITTNGEWTPFIIHCPSESDRKKIQHVEGGEVLSTAMYVSKEIAETQ